MYTRKEVKALERKYRRLLIMVKTDPTYLEALEAVEYELCNILIADMAG